MPYTGTAAAWPLAAAIAAALLADTAVRAALAGGDGIYNGVAPNGTPLPYLVLQSPTESDWAQTLEIGRAKTVRQQMVGYFAGPDARAALLAYGEMDRVLHGRSVPIPAPFDTAFSFLVGRLRLVGIQPDEAGEAQQMVLEYEATVRRIP